MQFPVPGNEDKAPKTIAETVASTIGVGKVTSPWVTVMILGMLAGAYIGFGGLLSTSVTFDMPKIFGVGFTKVMAGSAFSLGLMLVVIAGAELFTGNNLITLGALETIHKKGLKIPHDIAIIGFDDMYWSISLNPPLTAVRQPAYEIGKCAAEQLISRINNPDRPTSVMILKTELMIRNSC